MSAPSTKHVTTAEVRSRVKQLTGRDCPASTVARWITSGQLRGFKLGGRWLVAEADLEAFLNPAAKASA